MEDLNALYSAIAESNRKARRDAYIAIGLCVVSLVCSATVLYLRYFA